MQGLTGQTGNQGGMGVQGETGSVTIGLEFADFFALMPGDNAATVALGAAVEFPQDGPAAGTITRVSATQFNLAAIGTYMVQFQVSVSEAGQLQLDLNGGPVANSVAGRATGTSQIVGISFITTSAINTVLRVINPAANPAALTITPLAGGALSVSAHLAILRLS